MRFLSSISLSPAAKILLALITVTSSICAVVAREVPTGAKSVQPASSLSKVQARIAEKQVSQREFQTLAALIAKAPDDFRLRNILADCYAAAGLMELSEEQRLIALDKDPQRDQLFIEAVTRTYKEQGLLPAEHQLRVMQEKLPNSPVTVLLRVQLMLARDNDWGAKHVCDVWSRTHTNQFCVPTARAFIHFQHKRYEEALAELEKDLRVRPDFVPALGLKDKITRYLKVASNG